MSHHRNRQVNRHLPLRIGLIALVALLGIGSRRYGHALPAFVANYAGDTLWSLAAFFALGILMSRASTIRVALVALAVSVGVELSQLYHAPWIDAIRRTTVGGLLLGFGFLWSDLACYAAGVGIGVCAEILMRRADKRDAPRVSVPGAN